MKNPQHIVKNHTDKIGLMDLAMMQIIYRKVNMEDTFNILSMQYPVSASEYFMILRLAIYRVEKIYLESNAEIAEHQKSNEVYNYAIKILLAIVS